MKLFKYQVTIFILLFLVCPVQAEKTDPKKVVQSLLETIQKIKTGEDLSGEQVTTNRRLSQSALHYLDMGEVASKTLGKYWKKRSANEQKEFTGLISRLFKAIAFPNSARFFSALKISYMGTLLEGKVSTVSTIVSHNQEGEVEIDFIMNQSENSWKVADVILDGVSMRQNLRSKFHKFIDKKGYLGLLESLKQKLKGKK